MARDKEDSVDIPEVSECVLTSVDLVKKKKRTFKRKYLQPQPKKHRKRKTGSDNAHEISIDIPGGWNDVIKNISGDPVTEVEKSLLSKGKQFCPVELDPPIVRMQRELNTFYRILRLKWFFQNQSDKRSDLEKKFYQKSDWDPPKACVEIESMIERLQEKFDGWKPPRWIPDNLSKQERSFLKNLKENKEIVYMWEDKGPSFTKMTYQQYIFLLENMSLKMMTFMLKFRVTLPRI